MGEGCSCKINWWRERERERSVVNVQVQPHHMHAKDNSFAPGQPTIDPFVHSLIAPIHLENWWTIIKIRVFTKLTKLLSIKLFLLLQIINKDTYLKENVFFSHFILKHVTTHNLCEFTGKEQKISPIKVVGVQFIL